MCPNVSLTLRSGNTVRQNPEISRSTKSIEPAQLIFFSSGTSHIGASLAKFYPFYPPKFAKDIDFSRLCTALFLAQFHRTKKRLYWPGALKWERNAKKTWDGNENFSTFLRYIVTKILGVIGK